MHYINPIEILELNGRDAISIDNNEIKKAKKRLIADIELSEDGKPPTNYILRGSKSVSWLTG